MLKEFLANKSNLELKKEENKLKSIALKCTSNIQLLIKDFFHSPPIFKANIVLSWKESSPKNLLKRPNNERQKITFDGEKKNGSSSSNNAKRGKKSFQHSYRGGSVYEPPTGKYSTGLQYSKLIIFNKFHAIKNIFSF